MMDKKMILEPLQVGAIEVANRIAMAPMTRNRTPGTVPGPMNVEYYRQRAGAGLIITEATQISRQGVGYPNTPGIHSPEQVDGWSAVTQAVRARDGKIFAQLWHVGRISHPALQPAGQLPVAPSAIRPEGEAHTYDGTAPFVEPRALRLDEIPGIVDEYAIAARNALRAGFDGVEIHAANGYLIDQFLRTGSNTRNDRYGGSLENRARFLLEVTDAVSRLIGAGRVSVRLSPAGSFNDMHDDNPAETFNYVAKELSERKIAFLHVIEGVDDVAHFDFDKLRGNFDGIYMANEGYDPEDARRAVRNGRADMISLGKLWISNPDLIERLRLDAPLACADPATFYGGGAAGYIDYPTLAEVEAA